MDIAELGVRVTQSGVAEATMSLKGLSVAADQAAATTADFARAGATANQIAQLTGVSLAQARTAVATFGGQAAETALEVQGLALAQREMAAASMEVTAASQVSSLGLGRLRQSFATLGAEALGVNPIFGRLGSTMAGALGLGSVAVIGVLAGVSAIGYAYDAFTKDAREAQKAQDDLTASLAKWYRTKEAGPQGERSQGVQATLALIAQQQATIDELSTTLGPGGVLAGGVNKDRIAQLKQEIATERQIIGAGQADVTATITQSFLDQNKAYGQALADRLKYNANDAAARKQALAQLKADQALYAQYVALPLTGPQGELHGEMTSSMAGQIATLQGALNPKGTTAPGAPSSVADGLDHERESLLKAIDAADAYNKAASDQARLAGLSGEAHDLLAARIKAENEQIKANAEYSGVALDIVSAAIQASYDKTKQTILETTATQQLADAQERLSKTIQNLKPAALSPADPVAIDQANIAAATKAAEQAAQEQKNIVDTYLKDTQRDFSTFFENIFTKGITSFTSLFNSIRDLFFKMIADMLAADVMKKLAGTLGAGIAGVMGLPATAAAQDQGVSPSNPFYIPPASTSTLAAKAGEGLGMAGAGFGVGSMVGGFAQSHGLGMVGAGLGGALGGAATGAAIGALGGPIGVAAGAFIGGVAGAVGGLVGFTKSASAAAAALLAFQVSETSVQDTLAQWQAQISGTAADQKAAALLDLQLKYLQIQQTINQTEAGKKHEGERNAMLSEAASLYETNKTAIDNNTAAWQQNTGAINEVQGYRYQVDYFGSMPIVSAPGTGTASGGSTGGNPNGQESTSQRGDLHLTLQLNSKTVSKMVLKDFQDAAKRSSKGDSTQWATITTVN